MVPATALVFASCSKKEEGPSATAAESVAEVVEATRVLTPGERAAKLGIVGHLSKDTECVLALYDAVGMAKSLSELDVWQFIREVAKEEEGVDPQEEIAAAPQTDMIAKLLGEELFVSFGAGSAEQLAGLIEVSDRMSYHQMRLLARAFAEGVAKGDLDAAVDGLENQNAYMFEMVKDIGRLMPVIEKAQVPPVLVGIKVSDEETRGMATQQVAGGLALLGMQGGGEPVKIDQGGADLNGVLLKGEMIAMMMEQDRSEMDDTIGVANADRVLSALKEKNLVIAAGTLGDYVLVYVGGSAEACPLVDDVSDSLAADDDAVGFVDAFADKPVHGLVYYAEPIMAANHRSGFGGMIDGVRDGIQGVDGFGDTRELVSLLDMVAEREEALVALYQPGALGGLVTVDEGARFEVFGGGDGKVFDYGRKHAFSSLGEGEEVLLFADWVPGAEYEQRTADLVGALVETAYAFAGKVATMEVDSDLAEFQMGYQMFDQMLRKDLVAAWDGVKLAEEGLGAERALVVDLAGDFPPLPQVPQEIVEGGRFVRASYVAPVTDRAKLAEAWKLVDASLRSILSSLRDAGMGAINMPSPTNSEKNDLMTWYFDALAFSDDVKPSVTLNDQWFVASTSKTQAQELVAKAAEAKEGARSGSWCELNLDVLRKYVEDGLELVDANGDVVFAGNESELNNFRRELPRIRQGLKALAQFEAITLHDRMEDGRHRLTLHFKTR